MAVLLCAVHVRQTTDLPKVTAPMGMGPVRKAVVVVLEDNDCSVSVSHAALHAMRIHVYMESKSNLSNPNRVPAGTRREVLKLSGSFCRYDALGGAVVCILIRGGGYHHRDSAVIGTTLDIKRHPHDGVMGRSYLR